NLTSSITVFATKIDSRKIRLVMTVATIVLFVLSAGAPGSIGDTGH
ncbi:MAG: hypothetical protein HGA86_06145, partial [Anaerolineaceae bacterium]|nr:hypothetical protein [Anaerolineaceae bacterium]